MKRNQVIATFYTVLGLVLTYCLASSLDMALNGPFNLATTMNAVLFGVFTVGNVAVYSAALFCVKHPEQFN